MNIKSIGMLVLILLLSCKAVAGQVASGKILQMMVNTQHSTDMLFVRISGNLTGTPSCNINGAWQFVLPLDNELQKDTITSFLLSAYMSGKNIRLDGNNLCDTFSSIETLTRVEFLE